VLDLDIEKPMCGLLDVLHAFGFRGDGLLLLTQLQFLSLFFYNNCFASLPVSKCLLYISLILLIGQIHHLFGSKRIGLIWLVIA
jgi:hypothetical protein